MKRFKIKHPVPRWFAGLGVLGCMVVITAAVFAGVLYGLGSAALLIWEDSWWFTALSNGHPDLFVVFFSRFVFLFAACLGIGALIGLVAGSYSLGNTLFNREKEDELIENSDS